MNNTSEIFRKLQSNILEVRANLFVARRGERTNLHRHPKRWHISYTVQGKGSVLINDVRHAMRPGQIIMIYPNEPHLYAADKTNPYTVYHVHIDCAGHVPDIFPHEVKAKDLEKSIPGEFKRLAWLTHHSKSPTRTPRIMGRLLLVLAALHDARLEQGALKASRFSRASPSTPAFITMLEKMQQVPFQFPGIAQLAASMNMSRRNFTRYFRANTGLTVRAYYLDGMMTYARNLMELKEYTLKEIAWQCGYANSQNFLRAWRKHGGAGQLLPPGKIPRLRSE